MKNVILNYQIEENELEEVDLLTEPIDESSFPVIKLDPKGKILYANGASFEYLGDWLTGEDHLPDNFLNLYPGITDVHASFTLPLETKSGVILFDVVGFEDGGYVGLYGYQLLN